MRLVLTLLIILIPVKNALNLRDDFDVPHDPIRYRDGTFIGLIGEALVGQMIT